MKDVIERQNACYCALPLSAVPIEKRDELVRDHIMIKKAIKNAGIDVWDPMEGANPWHTLEDSPQDVYDLDTLQVVTPRFFSFTNIGPATGAGIEQQKAIAYNKIAVLLAKKGVYATRMSTGARRCIVLEYSDIEKQSEQITQVFLLLKEYQPGIGHCSIHGNCLIGFYQNQVKCLKGLIEQAFPELMYDFDQYRK